MPMVDEPPVYLRGGTQKDFYSPEEVVDVPCPLCGGGDREPIYTEYGVLVISRCNSCSLIYTSPRIKEPEKIYWGDADLYYAEARLIYEGKAAHHREPNYLEEIRLIERHRRKGRFLDVGCNLGGLLRLVSKRGWEVVGLEPSLSLASIAAKLGLEIHNCFLHELPLRLEGSFDVVALSDVFEHICEPREFLRTAARFLKEDGILYIKVPNARWNVFKQRILAILGRRPSNDVWDSCEHVVHYTDDTLAKMLELSGFSPVYITTAKPVQTPVWHKYVGHYYQYPSPWILDWRRHLGRALCYRLALLERLGRYGSVGYLAPSIVAVARPR
jgi:2-polyprenyl-3-methyl-5-hydroxy-6-metoxy-1,4-benzoquinol methylase